MEKYKDRVSSSVSQDRIGPNGFQFDKLKMDARAKREAKLAIKGENEGSKRE